MVLGVVLCELVLRLVDGRSILGLMFFAFLRPADHHNSRSVETELFELIVEVSMEAVLLEHSLALRSLRAPTVSASFASCRSAANMINHRGGIQWGCGAKV
jgi:hypothetical protein